MRHREKRSWIGVAAILLAGASSTFAPVVTAQNPRPMTFLDMQLMKQVGAPDAEPGRAVAALHALDAGLEGSEAPDRHAPRLAAAGAVVDAADDLHEGEERSVAGMGARRPRPSSSCRTATRRKARRRRNQIYVMRPDGGEARRVTDAKEGVSNYAISPDGRWLVYRSGKTGEEQLYRLPIAGIETASVETLTKQPAGVGTWRWAPDSKRIYFVTADAVDADEKARREKKFTVNIRNAETPLASLWALDLDPVKTDAADDGHDFQRLRLHHLRRRRSGSASAAARRTATSATSRRRASTPTSSCSTPRRASIERLTTNQEVSESAPSFSPDSKWIAFSAPDDLQKYSMTNGRALPARGRRPRQAVPQARQPASTATSASASGRRTATRSTSTRASRRRTS